MVNLTTGLELLPALLGPHAYHLLLAPMLRRTRSLSVLGPNPPAQPLTPTRSLSVLGLDRSVTMQAADELYLISAAGARAEAADLSAAASMRRGTP